MKHRRRRKRIGPGRHRLHLHAGGWTSELRAARRARRRARRLRRLKPATTEGQSPKAAARQVRRWTNRKRLIRRRPSGGRAVPGVQPSTQGGAKVEAPQGDGGGDSEGGGGEGDGGPPAGGGLKIVIRFVDHDDPAAQAADLMDARRAYLGVVWRRGMEAE